MQSGNRCAAGQDSAEDTPNGRSFRDIAWGSVAGALRSSTQQKPAVVDGAPFCVGNPAHMRKPLRAMLRLPMLATRPSRDRVEGLSSHPGDAA
jgi:hypothetical protein